MNINLKYKGLIVFLLLCFINTPISAEARAPELVINGFFEAIQKNDIEYIEKYVDLEKINNQEDYNYSIEDLFILFENIDIEEIEYSITTYDSLSKTISIDLIKPLFFNFVLQHQSLIVRENIVVSNSDYYRIISIYPLN